MKHNIIILDMDSTLSDVRHRVHFLHQTPKDWSGWNAGAKDDSPNVPIIQTVLALYNAYRSRTQFVVFSGRIESLRNDTTSWMRKHLGPEFANDVTLYLREDGDRTPDHILKERWLKQLSLPVLLAIDDRSSVVTMYRSHGICTLQCADGDY